MLNLISKRPVDSPANVATPLFLGRTFLRKAKIKTEPKLKSKPPMAL